MRRVRAIVLGLAFVSSSFVTTLAEQPAVKVALAHDSDASRDLVPLRRPDAGAIHRKKATSGGWWFSTAGIVLMLAVLGGGSVAAKHWKLVPGREAGPLKIVGRTFLTPKHAVYLVRAGGRTLLIGTGPQGAPSLLGELSSEVETRIIPGGTR